jgi:hypothetical protein
LPARRGLLRPRCDRVRVERDQERDEVARLADDQRLAGERAERLELALDVGRRDVLAARRLDQVLLAVGDAQVALVVQLADVAGAEEPVLGHDLGGLLGQVVVATHDRHTLDHDLAVGVELDLQVAHGLPDRADLQRLGLVHEVAGRTSRSVRTPP